MKKTITTLLVLVCFNFAFPQLGGEATYQFLNLVSSPRQAALGGKILTNVDYDVTQGLYNPATINNEFNKNVRMILNFVYVNLLYIK